MNYFRDQGPLLLLNGYRIVKIAGRGKNPIENGWTKKIVTAEDCENDNAADRSVGIICGEDVMCVDADIYEHELADRIMAVIRKLRPDCIIPTRYGARPKFAMLFRNVDNLAPTRSPMYTKGEGDERVTAQIEFRGKNQQFVAYGIHPATGEEYEWEGGMEYSPELIRVDELPPLTKEDFEKIVQELDAIARSFGYSTKSSSNSALAKVNEKLSPEDIWLRNYDKKLGKTFAQYEQDLFDSDLNPADYKDWITAGQAGHHEFDADPMAMEVWDKWSQQGYNYKDHAEIEAKWRSFRSDRESVVTYRTLLMHVPDGMERAGYVVNEKTLAIAVSEHLKGTLRFISSTNRWVIFEMGHWVDKETEDANKRISHVMDYILSLKRVEYAGNTTLKKQLDRLQKLYDTSLPALLDKIRGYLKAIGNICVDIGIFDTDRRYFGVGNGDIDLTTGEFLQPDPQRYISRHTKVCYDPEADCPRWKQTLRECLDDDETVDYFQRLIGQAALGQTNAGLLVFLYGGGCNGKTTILETIQVVFGDYQCAADENVFFSSGGGSTRADLIDLRGARLIKLSEVAQGGRINTAQMKRITGGDEISARAPYASKQEKFSIVGIPFIATNFYPDIREADDGTWRRIRLIEFPRNFDTDKDFKKDDHLADKLALEYEGILNWVIEGALKAQREGLNPPKKVLDEVKEYRRDNDLVGQFVEERLVVDGNDKSRIACSSMFKLWQNFCTERGDNAGIRSAKALTGELKRRYNWKRPIIHGYPHYKGVRQKEDGFRDTGED